MTLNLQQPYTALSANQKVGGAVSGPALHNQISLLLAILIIPTPSGVNLIA